MKPSCAASRRSVRTKATGPLAFRFSSSIERANQAVIAGTCIQANPGYLAVRDEFNAVVQAGQVHARHRRLLLQVLHSTRALDSALVSFLAQRAIPAGRSLGQNLYVLRDHQRPGLNRLPERRRAHYQGSIVAGRNRYIHRAGQYPAGDHEWHQLLVEMHACLTEVLRL